MQTKKTEHLDVNINDLAKQRYAYCRKQGATHQEAMDEAIKIARIAQARRIALRHLAR